MHENKSKGLKKSKESVQIIPKKHSQVTTTTTNTVSLKKGTNTVSLKKDTNTVKSSKKGMTNLRNPIKSTVGENKEGKK